MRKTSLSNREQRVFSIYKFLLLNNNINSITEELKYNNVFTFLEEETLLTILNKSDDLEQKIIPFIPKDWTWERFNYLEKAILINGAAEITLFFNKKQIVINESINFAKKYCEIKTSNLINAILDNF